MAGYTLYYTSEDVHPEQGHGMGTWSVYSERYESIDSPEPIEGSTVLVSGNHPTEQSARTFAAARQRQSYRENLMKIQEETNAQG